MTSGWKIVKWAVIVTLCLASLTFTFLATRKPWIAPAVPGVRLSPSRPTLRAEDVDPNGAFGKMQEGFKMLEAVGMLNVADDLKEKAKLDPLNSDIEEALKQAEPGLEVIREAVKVQQGRQVPTVESYEALLPYVGQARNTFRMLEVSARHDAATGHTDHAVQELLTAIQVGDVSGRGGTLISRLVSVAVQGGACSTLSELSWLHNVSPASYTSTVTTLLNADAMQEPFSEAIRYEWICSSNSLDMVFRDRGLSIPFSGHTDWMPYLFALGELLGSDHDSVQRDLGAVYSHLVCDYASDTNLTGSNAGFLVDLEERSVWQILRHRDPVGFILAKLVTPTYGMAFNRALGCRFDFRAAVVSLAIDQYEQVHGAPPATLNALVPDLLEKIPEDPFRPGQPLLYKPESGRHWLLYSVGTNGVDDGGVFDAGRYTGPDFGISTHDFDVSTNAPASP